MEFLVAIYVISDGIFAMVIDNSEMVEGLNISMAVARDDIFNMPRSY